MFDPIKKRYLYAMLAGFGAISLSIVLFFALFRMQGIGEVLDSLVQILSPFIYGGVVAYLLRPMCNGYEKFFLKRLPHKSSKQAEALAIALSILTMLLVIYALIAMIAPQVYYSVITMWNSIPSRVRTFLAWAESTFGEDDRMDVIFNAFNTSYENLYTEMENWVRNIAIPQVTTVISGVGSSMFKVLRVLYNLLIGLIVAVYVLFSRKRFARQCAMLVRSLFSERWAEAILSEVSLVDRMFGGFIDSKILDSAIIGILCYLGCSILRMPNTLLVSVFIGVTNVIPFFGPFIGAIPATLLILIEDPIKALWFVLFTLFLQQLDGNVIGPRIMGNRIGISGFWVMFAIIFFGGTWGVVGMVIGVPLFAVIYDLVRKFVRNGLRNKGKQEVWEQYIADYPNEQLPTQDMKMDTWSLEDWKKLILDCYSWLLKCWKNICLFASWVWKYLKKAAAILIAVLKKWSAWIRTIYNRMKARKN